MTDRTIARPARVVGYSTAEINAALELLPVARERGAAAPVMAWLEKVARTKPSRAIPSNGDGP